MDEALAREQKERALKARFKINDDARMAAFEILQKDFPPQHREIVKFEHEWADESKKFHEDMRKLMGSINDFPQTQSDGTRNTNTVVSPPPIVTRVQGLLAHLIQQHKSALEKPRDGYNNHFVFTHCIRKRLSEASMDELKSLAGENSRPVEKSFAPQDVQHAAIAQSTRPSQSSLDQEYLDASIDAYRSSPHDLRRRHSIPKDHDSAKKDETNISFPFENCTVICHHESRGMFEIFCPTCQGNSVADATITGSTTQKLVYLEGPLGLYTHFRQLHTSPTYINFATFEKKLLDDQCKFVKRNLTVQQVNEFAIESTDEESIVPKTKVEDTPDSSSFDNFPYLDSQNSSVVLRADRYWVELRCPVETCGGNSSNGGRNYGEFFKGVNGFERHIRTAHGLRAPEDEDKWEWVLKECSKWKANPIVDIRRLKPGDIPVVPIETSLLSARASINSPELNSQHPRPRWQSMAPPVPTFGTPARTLSNGVMAFSQSIKPAMLPNSRTGNPKGPELGHLEELHFLERVCPCTLNGHPCKAEGGCCRQQLCIDPGCQAQRFEHNSPGCPYDHDIQPTCGRGCLQLDNDMFDVIMKTGQCAFGHDEKATRLRLKAHQCFNH
ncbi:hypothetical protein BLS_001518 [Venturia inaequalis]|uniref:Uncharacterized protein n=1 Tax=Venturia inaequalis TaxID=5025 RepID=A0A8H3U1W9_VENIN|nr:hypothetical protein BLS_001518 [Venturia inaequalis]